jgi:hypothetical protein
MAVDLRDLARGVLTYATREPALDDVRFDRIRSGFEAHYIVQERGPTRFSFERGEGYPSVGRSDAFSLVDSGTVERVRGDSAVEAEMDGNVIPFGPRYGWLRYSLNIRSILIVWALLFLFSALASGGDWLWWLVGVIAVWTITIVSVQRSLKAKVREWLARGSWN